MKRIVIVAMLLCACAPEPTPARVEFRDITEEVARASGTDPNGPPFAMVEAEECAEGDIWCIGADGYPAPYSDEMNENIGYNPAGECGWREDDQGRYSTPAAGGRMVRGRCCDSPRAFRERMNLPLTECEGSAHSPAQTQRINGGKLLANKGEKPDAE